MVKFMKMINAYYVGAVLEPFLFLSEEEEEYLEGIDPENENQVKEFIKKVLKPYYGKFDDKSKIVFKNTLGYLLKNGTDMWSILFDMNQPQFELPEEPVKFFQWTWEIFFEDEDYKEKDFKGFEIKNDAEVVNGIIIRSSE